MDEADTFSFDDVIGPVTYTQILSEQTAFAMENKIFQFYVPFAEVTRVLTNVKSYPLTGTNIYQYNSSFAAIVLHLGIIQVKQKRESLVAFNGARVLNKFDENWQFIQTHRVEIPSRRECPIIGAMLVVCITPEMNNFASSKQYDIKSKAASKVNARGIAVIYGEPVYQEPDAYPDVLLESLLYTSNEVIQESDHRWLQFGMTGDPMNVYHLEEFVDENLEESQWINARFAKQNLYIETDDKRYEISRNPTYAKLKFCLLNSDAYAPSRLSPRFFEVPNDQKVMLHTYVSWSDFIWDEDSVTIEGKKYGPIRKYLWVG